MIVLIILISLLLFKNSFSIYFFQDDWFLLAISRVKNIGELLNFFIPRSDVQFYRPLSHEIFYFHAIRLFDFNPLGFHLIGWLFFILTVLLVWELSKKFIENRILQFLFILLYATSAIHYNSLYWIINFSYILVSFWYFVGFLIFLNRNNSVRKHFFLIIIYTFGLLSSEFMITFPVMLIMYELLIGKKKFRSVISFLLPLIVITIIYLAVRFLIFKPNFGTYQFIFSSFISSLRFFFMYLLNFPETIKDQMLTFYKINPTFLQTFSLEFYIFLANLITISFIIFIIPLIIYFKNTSYKSYLRKNSPKIIFALLWFFISLLPIIFVPSHISPHQGTIAIFGLLLFIVIILESYEKIINPLGINFILVILMVSWFLSSYTDISLNDKIHWIKRRADLAKYWVTHTRSKYPTLPVGIELTILTEDKEAIVALNDGRAFKEIYQDNSLNVIFKAAP